MLMMRITELKLLDGITHAWPANLSQGDALRATYIPSRTALVLGNDDDEEAWHLPCLD